MRNCWTDIFVLGMAQCSKSMSLATMLTSIVSHLQTSVSQEKLSASRVRQVTTTICKVQEYVRALAKLHLDPLAIFKPNLECYEALIHIKPLQVAI